MFIVGAVPDSFITMKTKQKSHTFKEKPHQRSYKMTGGMMSNEAKSPNQSKKSFWNKVTGGRMR